MTALYPEVLLVEDDPSIREALCDVLLDEGYHVTTAQHGRAAVDLLQAGCQPQIILLDLMMPVMDGWQFMNYKAQQQAWSNIPVIVLSAVRDGLPTGAHGLLGKPVDLCALFDAMGRYCPHGTLADDASKPPDQGLTRHVPV